MKCEKCGCDNPKGCECCGDCGAQMTGKAGSKAKTPKRPAAKKASKHH